jgi:hypothetical protein
MRTALLGVLTLLAAVSPAPPPGCPPPLAVLKAHDPKASCAAGSRSEGRLIHGARLPDAGCGFRRLFPHRQEAYGTDELVAAVVRTAARLARRRFGRETPPGPRPPLGVGNLSTPKERRFEKDPYLGRRFSRSHASGRAVDLAFFVLDRSDRPVPSEETGIGYRRDGWNTAGIQRRYRPAAEGHSGPPGPRCKAGPVSRGLLEWRCFVPARTTRFDDARNWALVRALLLDPEIGVIDPATSRVRPGDQGIRRILVSSGLRDRLLAEAFRRGDPDPFIEVAAAVMTQPSNAPPHDDHLHIDVNCARDDIEGCGCRNAGVPPRPHAGRIVFPPRGTP